MENIRKGCSVLKSGLRKPHNRQIFDGIKNRSELRYKDYLLNRLIKGLGPKNAMLDKRRAFNTWKKRLGDTGELIGKLRTLLDKYLMSPTMHRVMIKDHQENLVICMNAYDKLKQKNALPIQNFCRGLLPLKRQMNVMKRSKILRNRFNVFELS